MTQESDTSKPKLVSSELVREINESKVSVVQEKYAKYEEIYRDMLMNRMQRQPELDLVVEQLLALGETDELDSRFDKIEQKVLAESDNSTE